MNWVAFSSTFVTLLVIMDPIGTAPIFVALTAQQSPAERRRSAVVAVAAAGSLVLVFALGGELLLGYLRVSVESLTIAGGLLLLLVALQLLSGRDQPPEESANVSLVPLATPLLAGPGAIAAVMVLARRYPGTPGRLSVVAGIGAVLIVVLVGLLVADQINRVLKPVVAQFVIRVLGLLLAAIAVQLVIDGVRVVIHSG
ncbi:MAG: MarC family protein [Candidatus Dormibacteria bacterium]